MPNKDGFCVLGDLELETESLQLCSDISSLKENIRSNDCQTRNDELIVK